MLGHNVVAMHFQFLHLLWCSYVWEKQEGRRLRQVQKQHGLCGVTQEMLGLTHLSTSIHRFCPHPFTDCWSREEEKERWRKRRETTGKWRPKLRWFLNLAKQVISTQLLIEEVPAHRICGRRWGQEDHEFEASLGCILMFIVKKFPPEHRSFS